jgi:hypothetical protein
MCLAILAGMDSALPRAVALLCLTCAGAVTWAPSSRAQEWGAPGRNTPPSPNGPELKVGTGYTQGFGKLTPAQAVLDVGGPGLSVDVEADGRLDPRWSLGLQAEYQELAPNTLNNAAARGLAANVGVTYHGAPASRRDPWLRVGTGYRMLWQVAPHHVPTLLVHGLEIAKAVVGYDIRIGPNIALAPVVGADLNMFAWQVQSGWPTALPSAQLATFVFAGIQGRFDLGGRPAAGP